MDREELADFLRRRRAALSPLDVGLNPGSRRRTPGLRRDEVAHLANLSTDFYTRMEQRRGARPSAQTVDALAGALQLTRLEREHLYALAGHTAPPRALRTDRPSPSLQRMLDLLDTPAQISDDLGSILGQNRLAVALFGNQRHNRGLRRSVVYRWFTESAARSIVPRADHAQHSRGYVSMIRVAHARAADDPEVRQLVDALLAQSDEFATLWHRHEIVARERTIKRYIHPAAGTISFTCNVLTAENAIERLVVCTVAPGSPDEERLAIVRAGLER